LFIALGAAGVGVYLFLRAWLVSEYDRNLEGKARVLAALLEDNKRGVELEEEANLTEFEPGPAAEYFTTWLDGGGLIARSASLGERELPALRPSEAAPLFEDLALPDGRRGRLVVVRVP